MRYPHVLLCAVGVLAVCGPMGCGSSGGPPANTVGLASVEAFVYVDHSSGTIKLGTTASPPAGSAAAAAAAVNLVGSAAVVHTEASGHFLLQGQQPGAQTLHIVAAGTSSDVPITLIPDATVNA